MANDPLQPRMGALVELDTQVYDASERLAKAMKAALGAKTFGTFSLWAVRHSGGSLAAGDETADVALPSILPPPLLGRGEFVREFVLWRETFDDDRRGGAFADPAGTFEDRLLQHHNRIAVLINTWNAIPGITRIPAVEPPPTIPPFPSVGTVVGTVVGEAVHGAGDVLSDAAGAAVRGAGVGVLLLGGTAVIGLTALVVGLAARRS